MDTNKKLLGIDMGTGGCKATLISCNGDFIIDGFAEYDTMHPHTGWAEQDPNIWMPAIIKAINMIQEISGLNPADIECICFDASAHNAVLLDKNDNIIRPTIMWTDQRSAEEAAYLKKSQGKYIFKVGYQVPNPTWTISQLLWIKNNEPEAFSRIHRIMFIKDYVRYLFTGTWTTDHIEAQGSLLFDNIQWKWSEELCKYCGLDITALPPIVKPTDVVGMVGKRAAQLTGLREGTPIINGASDTSLESYAVGAIAAKSCLVKLATAGTVNYFTNRAYPNPKALTYSHVVDGLWYTCMSTSSAAESLRWFRNVFFADVKDKNVYKMLDAKVEEVPVGAEGLIFHPHLMGERSPYWDNKIRGSFVGLTSSHSLGHFARSIMEGVCFSINVNFRNLSDFEGIPEVKIVGGGSKSPIWCQMMSDILERTVIKYKNDDSSFGAAMLAGVGTGVFASHEEAVRKCLKEKQRFVPNVESMGIYRKNYAIYQDIHEGLIDIYHKM